MDGASGTCTDQYPHPPQLLILLLDCIKQTADTQLIRRKVDHRATAARKNKDQRSHIDKRVTSKQQLMILFAIRRENKTMAAAIDLLWRRDAPRGLSEQHVLHFSI